MASDRVNVLVASPLEPEHAARIEAAGPRVSVLYEPDLLPVPRYPCDHIGVPRPLSAADLDRWAALRQRADVSFDFDWQAPADMAVNCPRLRWGQGTSAGIGGFRERTRLAGTPLVFTTAAVDGAVPVSTEEAVTTMQHLLECSTGAARPVSASRATAVSGDAAPGALAPEGCPAVAGCRAA